MNRWSELVHLLKNTQIPAPELRTVVLAQWALESGYGSSDLAQTHNNYSGLKWREEMKEIANKIRYGANDGFDCYCEFSSLENFIKGYWIFIARDVYEGWQQYKNSPHGYISFLKDKGFAGDPNYVEKVMKLLPEAENWLVETEDTDIDRPSISTRGNLPSPIDWVFDAPELIPLVSVSHNFVGNRPNGLEGMIIHYDAGRNQSKANPNDLEWGAKNSLEYGETSRYSYITLSRSGKFYFPNNFSWNKWGYHAGISTCPKTQRKGVSKYYIGIEVNCPGLVYKTSDKDKFVPWFNAAMRRVNKDDGWIDVMDFDSKNNAKIKNLNDTIYTKSELRHIQLKDQNVSEGYYVPYTVEQFKSLVNISIYLKKKYKDTFRLDYIFGHDEVAPNRKVDPGASLGLTPEDSHMTMEKFRKYLYGIYAETP